MKRSFATLSLAAGLSLTLPAFAQTSVSPPGANIPPEVNAPGTIGTSNGPAASSNSAGADKSKSSANAAQASPGAGPSPSRSINSSGNSSAEVPSSNPAAPSAK